MFNFTTTPPLSLYIHIPWCVRKCPYCDFNSHEAHGTLPERAYIEALIVDLEEALPAVWGRPVETVFIGGGTPSLFSPDSIGRLLDAVRARVPLVPCAEITLEANPGTVERERFAEFRSAGINRLSIGVQSFQPGLLDGIGRIHTAREAIRAAEGAHDAGLDNFNLDLMFGLPGQTRAQALDDLRTAIDLEPAHLSWYELTIEPNTWFYRHPPQLPDDDTLWELQAGGTELLAARGFMRYEVSAFARTERQCRHNLNYWRFGDYLGIGAGAHGKLTDTSRQTITRTTRQRHPQAYLEAAGTGACTSGRKALSAGDVLLEYAMNALRLDAGFDSDSFSTATGLPYAAMQPMVEAGIRDGLLSMKGGTVCTTARGQRYLDELLQYWLPETDTADGG